MLVANIPNIIPSSTVMNTTINSAPIPLLQTWGYAIQVVFTGTPTGTFKLQASCDPIPQARVQVQTPVNWTDIANSSNMVTAAGNYMWNVFDIAYNYVRVVYNDGSGGTSAAIITVATANVKSI
jgi:hypothetical protein